MTGAEEALAGWGTEKGVRAEVVAAGVSYGADRSDQRTPQLRPTPPRRAPATAVVVLRGELLKAGLGDGGNGGSPCDDRTATKRCQTSHQTAETTRLAH